MGLRQKGPATFLPRSCSGRASAPAAAPWAGALTAVLVAVLLLVPAGVLAAPTLMGPLAGAASGALLALWGLLASARGCRGDRRVAEGRRAGGGQACVSQQSVG